MYPPIFVRHDQALKKIDPVNIVCLSTDRNYTKIFLSNDQFYLVRCSMSHALKKLPKGLFLQIHRSIAVSINFIDEISKDHVISGEDALPIGPLYYDQVIGRLNIIE